MNRLKRVDVPLFKFIFHKFLTNVDISISRILKLCLFSINLFTSILFQVNNAIFSTEKSISIMCRFLIRVWFDHIAIYTTKIDKDIVYLIARKI